MSVNQNQSFLNGATPLFMNAGSLSAPTTINPVGNISSIYTDHIILDGVGLDCSSAGGGQLLVNGVALASVSQNVSSIANWATYPALSSIVYTTTGGTGGALNMNTGIFSTLTTVGNATVSTIAASGNATVSGLITSANHNNTGLLSTLGFNVSTINGNRVNFYDGTNVLSGSYTANNDSTQNISVSSLADGLYIFYTAGATTVGKEFVFPFQVYGGTSFAGATVFNFGPAYVTTTDYGPQNSMSAKGNAATSSKTIGIYYQSTVNPTETMNYYVEFVGAAYRN
jgi:hypothetical protein